MKEFRWISLVFALLFIFILFGCTNTEKVDELTNTDIGEVKTEAEETEINPEIRVTLDLEIVENGGKVNFFGETNLPEGTEVMITLSNESGYKAQDKVSVNNGSFESNQFSDKGSSLEQVEYSVKITTPTANVQPENVKTLIGENGINLIGELVKGDDVFGNMVEYNESFTIGDSIGSMTAEWVQEPTEDDVYNFMVEKYNELTNYGANYVPEIHDSKVTRLASEKLGITASEADRIFIEKEMEKFK